MAHADIPGVEVTVDSIKSGGPLGGHVIDATIRVISRPALMWGLRLYWPALTWHGKVNGLLALAQEYCKLWQPKRARDVRAGGPCRPPVLGS